MIYRALMFKEKMPFKTGALMSVWRSRYFSADPGAAFNVADHAKTTLARKCHKATNQELFSPPCCAEPSSGHSRKANLWATWKMCPASADRTKP